MKSAIREYIELTDAEKAALWEHATFVFDTNVYLNLYRYSKKTRDALIEAMRQLSDRIWMPRHVAQEFMKRRPEVIYEATNQYKALQDESQKFFDTCTKALRFKDDDAEYQELQSLVEQIKTWLDEIRQKNLLVERSSDDAILNTLLELYDSKVGAGFTDTELDAIRAEGAKRYAKRVPPGYKDAPKAGGADDNNAYGDLIIWKEILRYAKAEHKDIVYVTHDQKEDWWSILHGETIGPRVELRREFLDVTGQRFHMYNMTAFIQRVKSGGGDIDQSVINEVKHTFPIFPAKTFRQEIETAIQPYHYRYNYHLPVSSEPEGNLPSALQEQIDVLKAKNRKRVNMMRALKRKYVGREMPPHIQEQISSNERNYARTLEEIARLKGKLAYLAQ